MKRVIKAAATALAVITLIVLSFSFAACFPSEIEDGRFDFVRASVLVDGEEYTGHNSAQLRANAVDWAENSMLMIRPQVPAHFLPMFDVYTAMLSLYIYENWRWIVTAPDRLTEDNEGRFYVIRDGRLYSSRRGWSQENNETSWLQSSQPVVFVLESGRFVSNNIVLTNTKNTYHSLRAFSQNRIVRTHSTNLKYDFFGDDSGITDILGIHLVDISGLQDFWVSERLIYGRTR